MVIISGGIDLSVGSIYALSGVTMALLLREHKGLGGTHQVIFGLFVCLLVGLLCGLLNGLAITRLKVSPFVGTKVRVPDVPVSALAGAVARGLEESLRRLGRDRVDLFQLHNHVTAERTSESLTVKDVRDVVFPAMARLAEQGKIGFYGITALGETASVLDVIGAGRARTAQVCYNLLNPSAGHPLPPGFPAQDFGRLLERCREQQMGVIVVRVLAAGALSGTETRHPVAAPAVDPIASAADSCSACPARIARGPGIARWPRER